MGQPSGQVSRRARLRYAFDNTMSKGAIALIGWLAVVAAVVILAVALFVWFAALSTEQNIVDQAWVYLLNTLGWDPMTGSPWVTRLASFVVALCSVFVMSALIGVITTGINSKLEELRKVRSRVIETGHTAILGWSAAVFTIIPELVVANENQPKSTIVVLGDKDKVEMEDAIRDKVGATGRTRIVCRTGSQMSMTDLEIASPQTAKSIIILPPETDGDPDASVIETLLAIVNSPNRRTEPYHIVAALQDPRNLDVARLVGREEVELVLVGNLIARITAQTCRQSGLSVAYTELLDFGGDEIYFKAEPGLVGKTFGEALLAYEDSAVIGLWPGGSSPRLNPPMSTNIQEGDRIIAIAEDDDKILLSGLTDLRINEAAIRMVQPAPPDPEHILLLGWNNRATTIINELDNYVAPGSTVTVVSGFANRETEVLQGCPGLKNLRVTLQQADTTSRRVLDGLPLGTIKHVILLSYSNDLAAEQADAHTLITLLHLRHMAQRKGYSFSIVSEMLDVGKLDLVQVTHADDFVVSDKLISLMLSQISENKALGPVFADLFDPAGSEIYLKAAADYVALGEPVNFYTVVEATRRRGEVALGYRLQAHAGDAKKAYGVTLNPDKSVPVTFAPQDKIIVLAED